MHLRGNSYAAKDVIGVYPLFSDRTCRFLVFDFDNHEKNAEKGTLQIQMIHGLKKSKL